MTNADLAARVRLSPSPCLARVRALEQQGVITGYVALLDPQKVGLKVSVFIQVSLEKQVESALDNFESAMQRCSEVMECYLMTGDSDYLIRVVITLHPGDVIATGTPAGVGLGRKPPEFLKDGDIVEAGIQGLGKQRQLVISPPLG